MDVTLPVGVAAGDGWRRDAAIRPLRGSDEAFLTEARGTLSPAAQVTGLLSRCLASLAGESPVSPELVRDLTVGDREALLLHLRMTTLGRRLTGVIHCPRASCGEPMTIDLEADHILCGPSARAGTEHVTSLTDGRGRVRFRLPTGRDLEAVTRLAHEDIEAATIAILRRCVQAVEVDGQRKELEGDLLATVRAELPPIMAELDPQAETTLAATCPECETGVTATLDAGDFVIRELAGEGPRLYQDVHIIASHYHWTERQILAMPRSKRRFYLELIAGEPAGAAR